MRTIARWILQCLQHMLGIVSPSTGRIVQWPWAKPSPLDMGEVMLAAESFRRGGDGRWWTKNRGVN